MPRTITPAQADAARRNGKTSQGPVTPAGKLASRRNALKHGFAAQTLTLDREADDSFSLLLASYEEEFQPQTPVEHSLVLRIAHAEWRTHRLWSQEKALLDNAMEDVRRSAPEPRLRTADCSARALQHLASAPVLTSVDRLENRYERIFHRAILQLERLRERRERVQRVRALSEQMSNIANENGRTNPATTTKHSPGGKTTPPLLRDWRPSETLEAKISSYSETGGAGPSACQPASSQPAVRPTETELPDE